MSYLELEEFFNSVSKEVNPIMRELLTQNVDCSNRNIVSYQASTGGKRLRPALAVATCKMFRGEMGDIIYPAAGLEILHNYSLIIDDIVDDSNLRRGEPTLWFKFGRAIAEIVSIDYSAAIFEGANRSKHPKDLSSLFTRTMKILADGEILDLLFEQLQRKDEPYITANQHKEITEEDYFKMVKRKTAELIKASCEVGGLVAGAKKEQIELLRKYGFKLGIAFQIKDDILDIFGEQKVFGKKLGKDIEEGKLGNIIVLLAFKEFSSEEKRKFMEIINGEEKKPKDISQAIDLINKTDALAGARKIGEENVLEAKKSLSSLPQNKWNDILRTIAEFVLEREK